MGSCHATNGSKGPGIRLMRTAAARHKRHPFTQHRRSGMKVRCPLPHPRGMHPPSLTPYDQGMPYVVQKRVLLNTWSDQLQPTKDGDTCTKDDDDQRTPRSPLPPTVHWAQRPWHCAQVRNADRQTPQPTNTMQHLPPR